MRKSTVETDIKQYASQPLKLPPSHRGRNHTSVMQYRPSNNSFASKSPNKLQISPSVIDSLRKPGLKSYIKPSKHPYGTDKKTRNKPLEDPLTKRSFVTARTFLTNSMMHPAVNDLSLNNPYNNSLYQTEDSFRVTSVPPHKKRLLHGIS